VKKFSEMNIQVSQLNIFQAQQVTITEILNREVQVIDYQSNVKTTYGPDRYIVLIELEGNRMKFFTDSKRIKEQLDQVPKEDFPFLAIVSILKFGDKKKTYQFT
jgi:hypothetical protein